jgi:CRISPR-associated endonuclease/helicase Cas3
MRSVEQVKPLYYQYWGKTSEDGGYHLLPYHCLDVAAVGEVFLRRNDHVRLRLAQLLGLDEKTLIALVVFFLGLHDIGKFARHFQALNPELFLALQGEKAELPYVRQAHRGAGSVREGGRSLAKIRVDNPRSICIR